MVCRLSPELRVAAAAMCCRSQEQMYLPVAQAHPTPTLALIASTVCRQGLFRFMIGVMAEVDQTHAQMKPKLVQMDRLFNILPPSIPLPSPPAVRERATITREMVSTRPPPTLTSKVLPGRSRAPSSRVTHRPPTRARPFPCQALLRQNALERDVDDSASSSPNSMRSSRHQSFSEPGSKSLPGSFQKRGVVRGVNYPEIKPRKKVRAARGERLREHERARHVRMRRR